MLLLHIIMSHIPLVVVQIHALVLEPAMRLILIAFVIPHTMMLIVDYNDVREITSYTTDILVTCSDYCVPKHGSCSADNLCTCTLFYKGVDCSARSGFISMLYKTLTYFRLRCTLCNQVTNDASCCRII